MTRKTKIIIASIIGVVVVIPVILFIVATLWVYFNQSSTAGTGFSVQDSQMIAPNSYEMMPNENARYVGAVSGTIQNNLSADESSSKTAFYDNLTSGSTAAEVDQKIIKTGYLDITVEAVNEVVAKITALTTGKGGYTQDSSVSEREDGTKFGNITVRVPVAEFENTMVEIKKFAIVVDTESANGQDVTEEYTDLAARLKNAQAQEVIYLEILNKAETVEDILAVQSYLGNIREQIETLQGRIKYLENKTGYSTISVSLSEESTIRIPSKEFRPWSAIKEAAQSLVVLFQGLVITIIWLVILGGGLLLPIALVVWLIVKLIKKLAKNRRSKKL